MSESFNDITDPQLERPLVFDYLKDLSLFSGFASEFSDNFLLNLNYYPLNWNVSKASNIYGENDSKTYEDPVRLRANVELDPPVKLLEKYGIQHKREVIFYIAMIKFKESGINPKTDDQIEYEHVMYKVTEVQKEDLVAGTNQATTVALFCTRAPKNERAYTPT
jgi:hypothetical protein